MGGYNFSLLSDDDEQKKLEEQQNILQQLIGDDSPTSAVDHTPSQLSASATDPDVADFRARLSQAQSSREHNSGGDLGPLEELVRQHENRSHLAGDIDTGLAMLLDLGANKGRGLGQITGAYVSNRDAEDRQGEALQKDLAMAQARRKSGQDPVADLFRQQALENGIRGLQERDKQVTGVQARAEHNWAQNESPEAAKQTTAVEVARRKAAANVEGRETQRAEMLPTIENTESGITGARTTAGTESKNKTPPDITPAERERLDIETKRLADQEENTRIQREIAAQGKRKQDVDKLNATLGPTMDLLNDEKTLESLIGTDGDIPGMGPIKTSRFFPDAALTADEIATQKAFAHWRNPQFRKESGATVSPSEAPRLAEEFGKMDSTNPEVVRAAVRTIGETLRNTIRSGVIGREDIAREILHSRHLDDVLGPAAPTDDALPVTRGAIPKASDITGGGDARSKQSYRLRSPRGKTGTMQLSDEELQKLEAKGFQVL